MRKKKGTRGGHEKEDGSMRVKATLPWEWVEADLSVAANFTNLKGGAMATQR